MKVKQNPGPIPNGPLLIDSHVHALPEKRLRGLMRWIKRAYPDHPVPLEVSAEDILRDLRGQGVTHFFNLVYPLKEAETLPLNEFNARFCQETPGAIPFASLHPETRDKAQVAAAALAKGFVGFKFHPFVQGFEPWDPRLDPLYEFLQEARRPVILHTGFEEFYGLAMPIAELERLARRYPQLPLVFVHMAFPELERVFKMMEDYPELYLDATNVLACFRPEFASFRELFPDSGRWLDLLVAGLTRHQGRIMYGSDHPAGMGGLADIRSDPQALPLDPVARQWLIADAARAFISRFLPDFDWTRRL